MRGIEFIHLQFTSRKPPKMKIEFKINYVFELEYYYFEMKCFEKTRRFNTKQKNRDPCRFKAKWWKKNNMPCRDSIPEPLDNAARSCHRIVEYHLSSFFWYNKLRLSNMLNQWFNWKLIYQRPHWEEVSTSKMNNGMKSASILEDSCMR